MALGKKSGGRRAGSPNRRTIELKELLKSKYPDWDPILQLAAVAQNTEVKLDLRIQCAKEVAPYLYPKRKSTEISSTVQEPVFFDLTFGGAAFTKTENRTHRA
jgi:hypothetical protein